VRHLAYAIVLLVVIGSHATAVRAQESAYRFGIARAGDSTFTFPVARNDWVDKGMRGIVVDPTQRDALIARFRVMRVDHDSAVALVTGQTTHVTTDLVALLERPSKPWFLRPTFWIGGIVGAIVGVVASR
jgi:hypothetical protein